MCSISEVAKGDTLKPPAFVFDGFKKEIEAEVGQKPAWAAESFTDLHADRASFLAFAGAPHPLVPPPCP